MRINSTDNQIFQAKKFQLPIYDVANGKAYSRYLKEFDNPHAEEIYNQIKLTSSYIEREHLYKKMGNYKIIDNSFKARLERFIDKLCFG